MKNKESFIEELRRIFVSLDVFDLTNKSTNDRLSNMEKIFFTLSMTVGLAVIGAWMSFILKKP